MYISRIGKALINVKDQLRPGIEQSLRVISEAKAQIEGYPGGTCKSHATVEQADVSLHYARAHCKGQGDSPDNSDGLEDQAILIKKMAGTTL